MTTTGDGESIIEEIKESVHNELYQDAVDNISFVMQNREFRDKLSQLIERVVADKLNSAESAKARSVRLKFTDED